MVAVLFRSINHVACRTFRQIAFALCSMGLNCVIYVTYSRLPISLFSLTGDEENLAKKLSI